MSEIQLESIIRGDDVILHISIVDPNGVAGEIGGDKIWFTIKTDPLDADQLALLQREMIIPTDAESAQGITRLQLTSVDTDVVAGYYHYDLQWQRLVSGASEITTLQYGRVRIIQHVTHATE